MVFNLLFFIFLLHITIVKEIFKLKYFIKNLKKIYLRRKRIDMHKIKIVIVFGLVITSTLLLGTISADESQEPLVTRIVELPIYNDYSPHGLPDFDQRQDPTWYFRIPLIGLLIPTWCGPTAAANLLWYLDSKHEDGTVGDGVNNWDLVPNGNYTYYSNDDSHTKVVEYHADDHTWESTENDGEPAVAHDLIECIADRSGTDDGWGGNTPESIVEGLTIWISDQSLSGYYNVNLIHKPDSDDIKVAIQNGYGAMIYCDPWAHPFLSCTAPHYLAIQGYIQTGDIQTGEIKQILIRDPDDCPECDPEKYNNAEYVNLSIEYINSSYIPDLSNLMIEDYLWNFCLHQPADAFVTYLIVIEET